MRLPFAEGFARRQDRSPMSALGFSPSRANHPVESLATLLGVLLLFTLVTTIFFWHWVPVFEFGVDRTAGR